jgi:hypothetical protein
MWRRIMLAYSLWLGVVGAVQGEGAQRAALGLDAVEPGGIGGHIGQLGVVGLCPLADRRVVTGRRWGLSKSGSVDCFQVLVT